MQFDQSVGKRFDLAMDQLIEGKIVTYKGVHLSIRANGCLQCSKPCSWEPDDMNEERANNDFKQLRLIVGELKGSTRFTELVTGLRTILQLTDNYKDGYGSILIAHLEDGRVVWDYKK